MMISPWESAYHEDMLNTKKMKEILEIFDGT